MTSPDPATGLRVSADLTVSVTAPDGSATRIRVSDQAGELLVDVDEPLTVLRALPQRSDRRALARRLGSLPTAAGTVAGSWPTIRIRTRGYTMAVARPGGVQPGTAAAVAAAAALTAAVAAVVLLIALARLVTRRRAI